MVDVHFEYALHSFDFIITRLFLNQVFTLYIIGTLPRFVTVKTPFIWNNSLYHIVVILPMWTQEWAKMR